MCKWDSVNRTALTLIMLIATAVAAMAAEPIPFELSGLSFGKPPAEGMICIRGNCPEEFEQISRRTGFPSNTYLFDRDITHWGSVPTTPPEYDFFKDRLYRIRFRLLCRSGDELTCLRMTLEEIKSRYGYEHSEGSDFSRADDERSFEGIGRTSGGDVVVLRRSRKGLGSLPVVVIYSLPLMEDLRHFSNPDYRSEEKK
jgi:hypothetical protein